MRSFEKKYAWLALLLSALMLTLGWHAHRAAITFKYKHQTLPPLPVRFGINADTGAFEGRYTHKPLQYATADIKKDMRIRRANLRRLVDATRYDSDPSPSIAERVADNDVFTEYRVLIPTEKQFPPVSAALFIPKNIELPAPAILFLHGHFEDNTRLRDETGAFPTNNHAIAHAKAGFIAIALENRGTGEFRNRTGMDQMSYINYELLQDRALLPLLIRDAEKALAYLKTLPEVDTGRIGVAGVSLGGELAMFMGALHPDLKAVVISGFLNIYQGLLRGHVHDLYWPGILNRVGEIPQIASLIAPRPLLIQHGLQDREFYTEGLLRNNANSAYAYVENIYSILSSESALVHDIFNGGHQYNNPVSIGFFTASLGK